MKPIDKLTRWASAARPKSSWSQPPFWSLDSSAWSPFSGTSADRERIGNDYASYITQAYKASGTVFSLVLARQLVLSEAVFKWRPMTGGTPGALTHTPELALLETPWPGGTTGELICRMELDASLAGNAYLTTADDLGRLGAAAHGPGWRIVFMRPDLVTILIGSHSGDPNALDAKVIGYMYEPPGGAEPVLLTPHEVCPYSPIPDPEARFRGMSWMTPVLREIDGDKAASVHKLKMYENGAVPGMVISFDKDIAPGTLEQFITLFRANHEGVDKAYKTLFLGGGADAKPANFDFKSLDFRAVQGAGETRMAAAAGVPPIIAGFSEGLSSATYSNYAQARRRFADGTCRPLWRTMCGSLQRLVIPPDGAQLWYDASDIAFLREDEKDAADIAFRQAQTLRTLIDAGFEAESVIAAVRASDWSLLAHSGLFSVQLQPPGSTLSGTPAKPPPSDDEGESDGHQTSDGRDQGR